MTPRSARRERGRVPTLARVNVKAQGLLNAVKWLEQEYGRDALGRVIRGCSPAVRERYMAAIAIEWHPVEELVELLGVADRMLGTGDGRLAEELGAAGARANLRGALVRMATYVTSPEFFAARVAGLWSRFNDEGEMLVRRINGRSSSIEVRGLRRTHPLFCATLTGWCREMARATGGVDATARHVACLGVGGPQCLWEVRWRTERPGILTPAVSK